MGSINFKIKKDEKEPIVVLTPEQKLIEFKGLMAAYKVQNPVKYAKKEESFKKNLIVLGDKPEKQK